MPKKYPWEITPTPYATGPVQPYTATPGGLSDEQVSVMQTRARINTVQDQYERYRRELEERLESGSSYVRPNGAERAYTEGMYDALRRANSIHATPADVMEYNYMAGKYNQTPQTKEQIDREKYKKAQNRILRAFGTDFDTEMRKTEEKRQAQLKAQQEKYAAWDKMDLDAKEQELNDLRDAYEATNPGAGGVQSPAARRAKPELVALGAAELSSRILELEDLLPQVREYQQYRGYEKTVEDFEKLIDRTPGITMEDIEKFRKPDISNIAEYLYVEHNLPNGVTTDAVEKYVDAKNRLENREEAIQKAQAEQKYVSQGFLPAAWVTVKNVPRRLIGGTIGSVSAGVQQLQGKDVDWYAPEQLPGFMARASTEQIASDIAKDSRILSGVYQLGNSALDMAAVAAATKLGVPPVIGTSLMGGSAAQQAMFDAKDRGMSDGQAVMTGVVAGVAETFFERVSLESFLHAKPITAETFRGRFLQTLRNIGVQAGVEGSEEVFTSLANEIYDRTFNGGLSEYSTNIRRYMEEGLSETEAKKKAESDFIAGLAQDFAGGALLGGLSGGVGTVLNTVSANKDAKGIYGADSEALVREALELDPDNETALEAQRRLEKGKKLSGATLRKLTEQNEAVIQSPGAAEIAPTETEEVQRNAMISGIAENVDPVLTRHAGEFGGAAEAFVTSVRPGQNAEQYYTGWQTAYAYGQANAGGDAQIDADVRADLRSETGLTDDQISLAYRLGQAEASRIEGRETGETDSHGPQADLGMTETEKGADNGTEQQEGTRVRDGGQRADGQSAGGQDDRVAEGTGGNQVWQAQGRSADRGAAAFTYARDARSSAQLIGSKGLASDRLRIVTGGKSASVRQAEHMAAARGMRAHFYTGGDMTVMKDGKAVKCRGYIEGKAVFIRADDPDFTADQIMRHEVGHDMIDEDEVDVEAVRERLAEKFTAAELEKVAELYAQLYADSGLTPEQIWEEIICDSLGDMNVFSDTMTAQDAPVALLLETAKQETLAQQKEARGPPEGQKNTAPGEGRMSRTVEPSAEWKAEQLRIIEESNPMGDDYHTGIRSVEDIKSFREALNDPEWDYDDFAPDYTRKVAERALQEGTIRVYSSEEIKEGTFVTPSRQEAESYAGGKQVNMKRVRLENVAWIDPMEGQYTGAATRSAAERATKGRTFSYAELIAKNPIQGSVVPYSKVSNLFKPDGTVDTNWLVKHVFAQCQTVQTNASEPTRFVSVADLGRNVEVSDEGVLHGIRRDNAVDPKTGRIRPTTNENAFGTINLGESLANAIEVNQLKSRGGIDIPYSHVLIGVTGVENQQGGTDYYAVRYVVDERKNQDPILVSASVLSKLFAVNAKKVSVANAQTAYRVLTPAFAHFSYSVADLLNDVKNIFDDTFSKDVYAHFGMNRRVSDFSEGKEITLANGTKQRPGNLKMSQTSDELATLRQENRELQERVKGFEKTMRQTEKKLAETRESRDNWRNKATFSPERVGREIIKAYDGTVKEAEIHDAVKAMIDHAARRDGISFEQMKEMAMPVARHVIQSAEAAVNSEEAHTWADIKKYHKNTELKLTTEVLADFRDDADFKHDFRRNYAQPLHLNNKGEGISIDVAYAEMGERFGYDLYPESITHPADQLRRMAEVLDNLKPVMENPYSLNMAMATEHCANELVDKVMGEVARGYRATYAGRLEEQLYQTRRSVRDMVLAERQRSDEQMRTLKKHWKEQQRAQGEKRMESEERDRLLKIARRLQNKKLPAAQRSLLDQYIGDLDTVSRSLTGRTLGDLNWLEHWYNEQKADKDFIPDAATEARIHRLYEKHVDDLSREDVLDLTYTLLNIENEMRTKNHLIESKEKRDVFEAGLQLIHDMENAPGSRASGVRSAIDKLIVTETLSPVRQARRITGYADGSPLTVAVNELADGQRKAQDYEMRALKRFEHFLEDKKFVQEIAGKRAREISIQGIGKEGPVEVQITPAMRISLYLHSLNPQNLRHIAGGGITVPDMKLYKQGKIQEAYARGTTVKLTPSQVRSITSHMSAQEMRFAQVAREYFNTESKDSINAVSEKLKGYSIAQVENYFPINTDNSFTKKEFESIKFDGTIEGMGFLMERINSASPIMLRDLNSVLTQAIGMHAKYVGLAVPVRNFNKLWGVTAHNVTEDGDMGASSSVQQTMGQQWGEENRKYFEKLMRDLQTGGREQNSWDKAFAKIRSNYAGAVLTLNMSVAMKQAASYPTAAAVVGWSPLVKAFKNVGKVDLDLIAAYTPLQWYRSRGFSTQELGDMAKQGKQLPAALNWVQAMDVWTTRKLWKAAEIYVADNYKGLERGTADQIRKGESPFYKKVAEVYNRIIEETQPNYTTMQRPQLLRSDSTLLQNLQMFKTQPFQNFNILYDAIGELQARERAWKNSGTEESKTALREAKRKAWLAVSSQTVQLAVFALMTAAWNAFRRKKDKYADEKGDVTFLSTLKGVGLDMIGGLFSEVPFGGDVWEFGSAMATNGRYNGLDDVTASALSDTVTALGNAGKTVSGLLKGEITDYNAFRLKMDPVLDAMSKTAGVPYENVLNVMKALYRNGMHVFEGDYMGEYDYLCLTTSPEKTAPYYDLLYEAYRKEPAVHAELYRKMVADGWDPDKIKSAMEKRMKEAEHVSSVKDLKERYEAP